MSIETLDHLFWECYYVQHFWNKTFKLLNEKGILIEMNKFMAYIGPLENTAAYYILMLARQYIYKCKFKGTPPNINIFDIKLNKRINLERILALKNDKMDQFDRIWGQYINVH